MNAGQAPSTGKVNQSGVAIGDAEILDRSNYHLHIRDDSGGVMRQGRLREGTCHVPHRCRDDGRRGNVKLVLSPSP